MMLQPAPRPARERGAIAVTATFFSLALCGVALALLSQVDASKRMFDRGESNLRSLEAAETGVARAEEEISCLQDTAADGVGNLTGAYAGATFAVTATQDPVVADEWVLRSRGAQGHGSRTIEVRVRRLHTSVWAYGMFAANSISISGVGTTTDSYDSGAGTYASQATNTDSSGTYAESAASIGSNGSISITNGAIRGDASSGPGFSTSVSGAAVVTGSTDSLDKVVSIPDTPLTTFVAAATANDNGSWMTSGGTVYNPVSKTLTVSAGNTLTLTKSTYFFSKIILSGGSKLKVTAPVKIYVTDEADFSGGSVVNTTMLPENLQIYQQPYALPVGYVPSANKVTLSGGGNAAFAYYGPKTPVTISGGSEIFGAVIGKSIVSSGGSKLHYDVALAETLGGPASIRRVYWRDLAPPLR